jgi:hypothetical protein
VPDTILGSCPMCLRPWSATEEALVLSDSTQSQVFGMLQMMIAAWTSDSPAMQEWGENGLRGFADVIRKGQEATRASN